MPTIVIKMYDLCPGRTSFRASAASEGKWAIARLANSNNVMVSSEGAGNAYYRYAGVLE